MADGARTKNRLGWHDGTAGRIDGSFVPAKVDRGSRRGSAVASTAVAFLRGGFRGLPDRADGAESARKIEAGWRVCQGTLDCLLIPLRGTARGERWTRIVGKRCGERGGPFGGNGRAGGDRRAVPEECGARGPGGDATRQRRQGGYHAGRHARVVRWHRGAVGLCRERAGVRRGPLRGGWLEDHAGGGGVPGRALAGRGTDGGAERAGVVYSGFHRPRPGRDVE